MPARAQRPSIPALVLLVVAAFAIMATSPAQYTVRGDSRLEVTLTRDQPAAEISFTSLFAAQPIADYRIEWDNADLVDVTTTAEVGGSFAESSVSLSHRETVTVTLSALDPASLNEPLVVSFATTSEHWIDQDPEGLTVPIRTSVNQEIERPTPPLIRLRPAIDYGDVRFLRFVVSTEAAVTANQGLSLSRRDVTLIDNRNLMLWNHDGALVDFPVGSTDLATPEDCLLGPCRYEIHLLLANQPFDGLEIEIRDRQQIATSPFTMEQEDVPLLSNSAQTPWGPFEVRPEETTFFNFDVELPSLAADARWPQVYFVGWETTITTDDESSIRYNNDVPSLPRYGWAGPGEASIIGGLSGFLEDDANASGIMTVTVLTADALASDDETSVLLGP